MLVGVAVGLIAVLHVVVTSVDPVGGMLSDYARTGKGWVFAAATLSLAAGSVLVLPWGKNKKAAFLFSGWCGGLVLLTAFPRDLPGAPATMSGHLHLIAALGALLALPCGALAAGVRRRDTLLCLALLVPLIVSFLLGPPLRDVIGVLERLAGCAEIVLLVRAGYRGVSITSSSDVDQDRYDIRVTRR